VTSPFDAVQHAITEGPLPSIAISGSPKGIGGHIRQVMISISRDHVLAQIPNKPAAGLRQVIGQVDFSIPGDHLRARVSGLPFSVVKTALGPIQLAFAGTA